MKGRLKKRYILGFLIGALFLWLSVRKVDLSQVWLAMKEANYWYLIPNFFFTFVGMWLRAVRWKVMLDPIGKVPLPKVYASTMIGFMANNVLPFRLGEFVRPYSVGVIGKISRSAAMATIALERVFDMFALLVFLVMVLILLPSLTTVDWLDNVGYLGLGVSLLLLLFLAALKRWPEKSRKAVGKVLTLFPEKISKLGAEIFGKFVTGLSVMGNGAGVLYLSFLSLLVWALSAFNSYFMLLAFGLHLGPLAWFTWLVVVSLGIMLPAAPGFIGTYQAFTVLSLALFGVSKETALAVSVVTHAMQFLPITLAGIYHLKKEHLSLKYETNE
ncbi:MAG: lysylphosphatidylglycerol synthase transmembrane domain-containing protein [Limisphaerales bacterium]